MAAAPPVPAASDGKRSLTDPRALARLKGVTLRARRVVDGVLQGLHRSPHHGASIEFAEHKEYTPGDEIRHVDWKAFGRFDKYYVKKYEQETNLQAFCVLDASASMGYGADGTLTKFEYAGVMITTLAYLLLRQQDAIGLVKYDHEVSEVLPPRSRINHLNHLTTSLETTKVKGGTNLEAGLNAVVEFSKKRGLVFVFSDFFSDAEKPFNMLRHLVGRGHQVTVFHVLDGDELSFPFEQMTLFEGMESSRRLLVEPKLVRRAYLKRVAEHQELIRKRCLDSQVGYALVDTREPPGEVVLRYLRANGPSKAGG
ncbi:MAG: DUF58 domain-containing protein [Deltaproteobacteria bacterium]|nr:MAG: DUF58 domain-containing protein [Deltaproteobacteria bacterium]